MSNQQSKKQSFPNKTQNWIVFGSLVVTYNFSASLWCTAESPVRTILDNAGWWQSQSCDSCTVALLGRTVVAPCHDNFNSGTLANGKTRMVRKAGKTTTVWFLVSNWKTMPLATKCQINNVKARSSPAQTWIALGKLMAT